MTEEQRAIFSRVLDTNWEIKELMEETKKTGKWEKVLAKSKEHQEAVKELKESMAKHLPSPKDLRVFFCVQQFATSPSINTVARGVSTYPIGIRICSKHFLIPR